MDTRLSHEMTSNSTAAHSGVAQKGKDAKELKEKLKAWSLKVAIDVAQKTFVVREMRPKELKREFLTGPRMFDEIMEKLEVVMNEMMADEGRVPMDLGDSGAHDAKMTQGDQEADNKMSYDDMCAMAWKGYKAGKGTGKKGIDGTGTWNRGKGYDWW